MFIYYFYNLVKVLRLSYINIQGKKVFLNKYKKKENKYKISDNIYNRGRSKVFMTGLGFKSFLYNKKLYLLLGYSHYVLIFVPVNVYILNFKKRLLMLSRSKVELKNFFSLIISIRKFNIYKNKGLNIKYQN